MAQDTPPVIIEPKQPAKTCVIWLHGLGADGHDFTPIVPLMKLPEELAMRFIFPHAPIRPVTINGGMEMRTWCDILSIGDNPKIHLGQFYETTTAIGAMIQQQIDAGISAENILIAGFSLGGALAIHIGLCFGQSLGGIIALSTFLTKDNHIQTELNPANLKTPIFIGQGEQDDIVPFVLAQNMCTQLAAMGCDTQWHQYPIDHTVSPEEVSDISQWIQKTMRR